MPLLPQDLRFAVRSLRRGRIASLFAILSLALGIAGNAVTFSLIEPLLFKPLPYPEPDRLVILGEREKDAPDLAILSLVSSLPAFADFRERSATLVDWSAMSPSYYAVSQGDRSVSVFAALVTPGFFRTLGAQAVRGRLFEDSEAVEGGPKVAVVTQEYWERALGSERDPLGIVLTLDGEPHQVVGVLQEGFEFIVPGVDIWVPLQLDPYAYPRTRRMVVSLARMSPGVSMTHVHDEVARIAAGLEREYPEVLRGWTTVALNLRDDFPDAQSRLFMFLIQGTLFFVLLIACANITNLLLARNQERRREIAVRVALGAGRMRIVRQMTRESLLVAVLGGTGGLALAAVGIRLFAGRTGEIVMRAWQPALDLNVLLFTIAVTIFCSLVFGLVPALQGFRHDQLGALRQGAGAGSTGSRRLGRAGAAIVVVQITLCFVALGAGAMMLRSFVELRRRDPGFDPSSLLSVGFALPTWKYVTGPEVAALVDRVEERVAALPGVTAAAVVTSLPQNLFPATDTFRVAGEAVEAGAPAPRAVSLRVSPEYLKTLGVPLLEGRFLERMDREGAPAAVVNRTLAARRFPGRSPIGERVVFRGETREIVGVVGDVQQSLLVLPGGGGSTTETIYLPFGRHPGDGYLLLRTAGDPRAAAEPARSAIAAVDPDLTVREVETMEEYAGRYLVGFDVFNGLLAAFAAFALVLASLGTYGVVAYSVGRRVHEIGVRMAVGARAREVVAMFAMHGVRMALAGLVAGGLALIPMVRLIQRLLSGMALTPAEPALLLGAAAVLFLVTLAASAVPASRAARVDPVRVLRVE